MYTMIWLGQFIGRRILLTFALHHRVHGIAEVVPVAGFDVELALGHTA